MYYLDELKEEFKLVNDDLLLEYIDLKSNNSSDIRKERFEEVKVLLFGNNWIDGEIKKFFLEPNVSKILNENKIGLNIFSSNMESFIKNLKSKDFEFNNDFIDR